MTFNKESDFENALITLLFDKGWEPEVIKYPTEADLIQNWANILFENNRDIDRLNDQPLTEGEMQQIMEQIKTLRTPVKLNGFINGKTVTIKRDNPADTLHFGHEVSLKIYDRQEIAAGQSRYQIAEQPRFQTKSALLGDRRGDFMLLINGMPVIHVELKKSGVPVSQAYYQIEKYAAEGVFTGLFSLVQIFVAMNPDETVYFANPGPDGIFNKDFYFHWADFNNEPVNDWRDIASQLLSIPMAHQMIGFYTVADSTDNVLKVMRSYQYYAASAISDRVARRKWTEPDLRGGYIWHTTGSGKTLTSFKSAQLIANSGDADKVVFLMDRIELGTQSLTDYRGYAEDSESVQETKNADVLLGKLKNDNSQDTLIVTSIQKMSRIEEEGGYNADAIAKARKKKSTVSSRRASKTCRAVMRPRLSGLRKVTSYPSRARARRGSRTALCSTAVEMICLPARRPCHRAARMAQLSLSVPQEVKTRDSALQPSAAATTARQSATSRAACSPRGYWEEGLPYCSVSTSHIRSATGRGTGVVAA